MSGANQSADLARIVSLDAFRGATILGMIVVNNPGTWSAVYPPLRHAQWHGWTPTDLIFPFFLFIVGVSIAVAYSRRVAAGMSAGAISKEALRRSIVLFALGLFMAAWPFITLEPELGLRPALGSLRIMGVLQRIAICYLAVSLLVLARKPRLEVSVVLGLLFGYWALMTLVPVPGYGAGALDIPEGTLAAFVDRVVFGRHLWVGADRLWDPEGLLSTLPAIATTVFGVWAGRLLIQRAASGFEKTARLLVFGVSLVIAGYVWSWFFPVNKSIWTSSYVLLTAGQAMCTLALCYWIFDARGRARWARPFVVYGVNAITVFVLSGLLAKSLVLLEVGDGPSAMSLQSWIFQRGFLPLASPINASLLYALVWVAMWWLVLAAMHRRGLILKV